MLLQELQFLIVIIHIRLELLEMRVAGSIPWIELLLKKGYHTVNIGKMHTWPFNTTCGFKERYNVENKDRFLEGRYYFDEWDKALASHGLVEAALKLRTREDYGTSLGAFDWSCLRNARGYVCW